MSTRVDDGAVRQKREKSDDQSEDKAARARKKAEAEAESRGTQSPVRLLFAFLIPVLLLIAYAMFGS